MPEWSSGRHGNGDEAARENSMHTSKRENPCRREKTRKTQMIEQKQNAKGAATVVRKIPRGEENAERPETVVATVDHGGEYPARRGSISNPEDLTPQNEDPQRPECSSGRTT